MLSGALVQVKFSRDLIIPRYVNALDPKLQEDAATLIGLVSSSVGGTRGELDLALLEAFGEEPGQFVRRGLLKMIDDCCEWSVESAHAPDEVRTAVFAAAFAARAAGTFDRDTVLAEAGLALGLAAEQVDDALFADLKSEQRLKSVEAMSPVQLLERYNVALAQSVVLKATRVVIELTGLSPARWRRLLRLVKFHRLIGEASRAGGDTWRLTLDGPLSMFSATQKYGLQLAMFLPAVLNEERFTLTAELRWGPEKKPKRFVLDESAGLTSRRVETGVYVPPEVEMFASQFRKKVAEWELADATEVVPLGEHFWVPDFRLVERSTGREVLLEILGFWRKGGAEAHVERLQKHSKRPFVLALTTSLQIDEETMPESARVVRFKSMPGPDAVAAAAAQALAEYDASAAGRRARKG